MKLKNILMLLAASGIMCASAIETSIAYQGVLLDAQGKTLTAKSHTITFRLYNQASGGTALWARAIAVNLDDKGLFNVELSDSGTPIDAAAQYEKLSDAFLSARGGSLYVGLEVKDSSGEISPRQKILMTPYSSWAADVTSASGDFNVSGRATLDSAEIKKNLTVDGTATIKGAITFEQNVTVSGKLTVKNSSSIEGFGTIPVGGIILWSGSTIPTGWALCDGNNGTPNLIDRFVYGGDTRVYSGAVTGGSPTVTLSEANLPAHSHKYAGDDQITNISGAGYSPNGNIAGEAGGYDAKSETKGSGKVYLTSKTGSGTAFSIMPPYYKLAYIMRIK
jgi:microcystin-dependent protein